MTEAELQSNVLRSAAAAGVLAHHQLTYCPDCGGRLGGHAAGDRGFPDLILAGPGGVLYRELKASFGMLRPAQTKWRHQLIAAGADYGIWRAPVDWQSGLIMAELGQVAA